MDLNNLDNDNVFDKLKEFLEHTTSEHFRILEEEIDIKLQMEYFEFSKKTKEHDWENPVLSEKNNLFDPSIADNQKKLLLVKLASVNNVEAYRAIEKFCIEANESLKNWAKLALYESRMLLESKLLDQNQIFISTGLGGKADKLRYFFVLFPKNVNFSELQKDIIEKEFTFHFDKNQSVLEELSFFNNYATLMALIPIQSSIKDILVNSLQECNQFGDFIKDSFIVTNVKRLDEAEITEIANKQQNENE